MSIEQDTTIEGSVQRIVYQACDSGYVVARVVPLDAKNEITITGHIAHIFEGQLITGTGQWVETRNYGKQLKCSHLQAQIPTSKKGLELYLSSGLIKGIGKQTAKLLIQAFGDRVISIIENDPKRLMELAGIGRKKSIQIQQSWKSHQHIATLMIFLQEHGIGMQRAIRIHRIYGDLAIDTIKKNPYQLIKDIDGIGFKIADGMAQSMGIATDDPMRIQSGLYVQMQESSQLGHSATPKPTLISNASRLLHVEESLIEQYLDSEPSNRSILKKHYDGIDYYYLARIYYAEQRVAAKIATLCQHPGHLPSPREVHAHMHDLESFLGYTLSESQKSALQEILSHKVTILTGGPGVGKTTLVQSVVRILKKCHKIIKLCAPTGRAAKRLQESTGHKAQTIHRALGIDPISKRFVHNHENPLKAEYCIIDESSMLDIHLTDAMVSALSDDTSLLFVGDIDQLPSVGPGKVLKDLIASQRISVIELTEIFRQSQTSLIITYAHRVRIGKTPHFINPSSDLLDCYALFSEDPSYITQTLEKLVTQRIPKTFGLHPKEQIQILCPMHKGPVGTHELNKLLQSWLNGQNTSQVSASASGQSYFVGDKVMQVRNNYDKDVFNGDIGFIHSIQLEEKTLTINFDSKHITYYFDELDEIQLAYAMSIHKSQGSEFPAVILPLAQSHYLMLERTLLYTAMTRAKKLLILLGQKKALYMAIQNCSSHDRIGFLQHQLEQHFIAH